jgi:hypothetical protein
MTEEEIQHPDGRMEHPAMQYEPTDVRFRWILLVIVVACGIAALHYYVVLRLFWVEEHAQQEAKRSPYPLAPTPSLKWPAEPRLEQIERLPPLQQTDQAAAAEAVHLREQEAAKQRVLSSYGPTDEPGFMHVPIEQAIKRVAKQLSANKQETMVPPKSNGLLDSGEPNSGRMFRGER